MKTTRLKAKDIILITLLSIINLVIFSLSSFLYATPFTVLFMPIYFSLTQGIVVYVIGTKVPKRGAFLIYCLIQSILGGAYLPYLLAFVVSGMIGELIIAKFGYGESKGIVLSYIVLQVAACIGSTIYPYVFAIDSVLEMDKTEDSGNVGPVVQKAGEMIKSWGMIVLIVVVIVSAYIGIWFGKKITEKHFVKKEAAVEHA